MADESPVIVIIFGSNCVGKSTVGRALTERFDKGAFIEVDKLRHTIVSGFVGNDADQLQLAATNAVMLAHNFAALGFSSVIEGLQRDCWPGTGWAESRFEGMSVYHILLMCIEETLVERFVERGWGEDFILRPGFKRDRAWYLENEDRFDLTVQTDKELPEAAAGLIADKIGP